MASEVRQIEGGAKPVRESLRTMYEKYRPSLGNGNGEKKVVDVAAESVEPPRTVGHI